MEQASGKSLLITGASGFIGSFLVERGLELGYEVWAAVRPTSSRRYLSDARIHFFEIDLAHTDRLRTSLEQHKAAHGAFDYVVHAAGATKAKTEADFFRVNAEGTARLAQLLVATGCLRGRFIYFSSLSVYGPAREADGEPIRETDTPVPNTAYGRSKQQAERELAAVAGLDYVVLRPTGVYGPRERDYYLMAKSVANHLDVAAGRTPQVITFIYVRDLVEAAYLALTHGVRGRAYFLTDGAEYSSRAFTSLIQQELGLHHVRRITLPLWLLRLVCNVCGSVAKAIGQSATLNPDKYRIMSQRNWRCDISAARQELGYEPQWPLQRGVHETIAWYVDHGWL